MARLVSQTLTRKAFIQAHSSIKSIHSKALGQVIELDLDSSENDAVPGIHRLEEVLQSIIAKRAAPDWLPFLPGYSYYVPPPPHNIFHLFGKLSKAEKSNKTASFKPDQTWPSSSYFIRGTGPTHPLPIFSVAEVKLYDNDEAAQESSSEDE